MLRLETEEETVLQFIDITLHRKLLTDLSLLSYQPELYFIRDVWSNNTLSGMHLILGCNSLHAHRSHMVPTCFLWRIKVKLYAESVWPLL